MTSKKKAPSRKNPPTSTRSSYARAGVDVALGNRLKSGIGALVKPTHGPEVLGGIGGFGGGVALKQALLALEGVSANEALQSLS